MVELSRRQQQLIVMRMTLGSLSKEQLEEKLEMVTKLRKQLYDEADDMTLVIMSVQQELKKR